MASIPGTSPPQDGGTVPAGATSLTVSFSESALGGQTAENYQLPSLGAEALLGTADDAMVPLSVSDTGTTATLTFDALPESVYRLTVHDTITDSGGIQLDGDHNGITGGDYVHDFVAAPRMFSDPLLSASGMATAGSLGLHDFDGDEILDVALLDVYSPVVGIRMGNGDGTFGPVATYPTGGTGPWHFGLVVDDFSGDGTLSIAVPYPTNPLSNPRPSGLAIADFNLNGRPDVVAALVHDGSVNVYLTEPDGALGAAQRILTSGSWTGFVTTTNFNSDGKPDILASNQYSDTITFLLGNGDGSFASGAILVSGGFQPGFVLTGDVNNDGRADVVYMNYGSGMLAVLLSGSPVPVDPVVMLYSPSFPFDIETGGFGRGRVHPGRFQQLLRWLRPTAGGWRTLHTCVSAYNFARRWPHGGNATADVGGP